MSYLSDLSTLTTDASRPAGERLHALFAMHWRNSLITQPEVATYVGFTEVGDRWSDLSPEGLEARRQETLATLKALESIPREQLSVEDQLNFDLFKYSNAMVAESCSFPDDLLQVTPMRGLHESVSHVIHYMPTHSVGDYENILSRLEKLPVLVDQTVALLERGIEQGVTPPQITLGSLPDAIGHLMGSPVDCPLLHPFNTFPEGLRGVERDRLLRAAEGAFEKAVVPALSKLRAYLLERYLPSARTTHGWRDLPNGEAWYHFIVRDQTTTHMSPQEIHEIGLNEVARLHREFARVMEEAEFSGTFDEFSAFMRSDDRFFFKTAEELLVAYRDICKRADPELPRLFGRLPALPYGVKAVPAHSEKVQTTAYYMRGSAEAGRPGWFYANTWNLRSRPKWEMEALSLHEAVPGHHLQIAIAQELRGLPEFRREGGYNAYIEGWGLYSESLGTEMGFYRDPWSRYGQLTYEMWRAVRLVLDTGLHALGWSREKAIDYFKRNTSKSEHDIEVEVHRYMVMPGQALSYKIGELKIKELRRFATESLGQRFSIRAFHDQILGQGALPLDILEAQVAKWLKEQIE